MPLNWSPTGVPSVQGQEGARENFPFGVFVLVTTTVGGTVVAGK